VNAHNRAKLSQEGKIKNPSTNRWMKDTVVNGCKIIQANKNKLLEEIRALRETKTSKIISNAIKQSLQPRLETTTYQIYFKYTIPTVVLNRVPALDIGSLSYKPDILMSTTIYNFFKQTLQQKLKELHFCRIFLLLIKT
jgi:hypothetical protein